MKWIAPDYYTRFRCVAEKCRHNCCIGWVIDVDADTLRYYQSITGQLGKRLKAGIDESTTPAHFILGEGERCPFLNKKNLCDLIESLGEEGLCQICRDHPRYRNFYSDRTEIGLGLCCEAAGNLIIKRKEKTTLVVLENDGTEELSEIPDMSLLSWREKLFAIVQNREKPIAARVDKLQQEAELPKKRVQEWAAFYLQLERLEESWGKLLLQLQKTDIVDAPICSTQEWEIAFEQLLVYFLYRHLPMALYDGLYEARVAFAVLSYQMLYALCCVHVQLYGEITLEHLVEFARQYSAEIEYSDENVAALLEVLA